MNSYNKLLTPDRRRQTRAPRGRGFAAGLLALLLLPLAPAQDDLPFDSGSDGSDGELKIPAHPTRRDGMSMAYDPVREQFVMFGGNISNTHFPETYVSDGLGWRLVETDTFLSARREFAMAWDAHNEVVVLFGGLRADGTVMDDFWAWDGEDWSPIEVDTPPGRYDHSLVANTDTGDLYLLHGRAADNTQLQDLWRWNGEAWTEVEFASDPPDNTFRHIASTYDPTDDAIVTYNEWRRETWKFKNGDWTEVATGETPNSGWGFSFLYNPATQSSILFGGTSDLRQTWQFKDDEWSTIPTAQVPPDRYDHAVGYDPATASLIVSLGVMDRRHNGEFNADNHDTWAFNDGEWTFLSGRINHFDMTGRADGIWNFTSIDIPSSAEVRFIKNAANTPVVWLATEGVRIDGIVRVDGQDGMQNEGANNFALGGPGGAPGGVGGIRFDISGNFAGTPGQGPGGGAPGVAEGQNADHGAFSDAYGNSLILPLVGGSGGGGGASNSNRNGGNGGGGGGAILIASGRDIEVNGRIDADGGNQNHSGASWGGRGSGGAIKLMADRVIGSGELDARGGPNRTNEATGRIRIEAFFRPLAANAAPPASATAPVAAPDFGDLPRLTILSVDGENVAAPPTGNLQTPDVVFTADGTVTIVVDSENVPQGTPVTLRITTSGSIINLPEPGDPDVTIGADGQAAFTATVPAGLGTIQAFTEFTP